MQFLFPLKDKSDYKLFAIYKGDCSFGLYYICEISQDVEVR